MNRRIPHDTTKLFNDIFDNAQEFREEWESSGIYKEGLIKPENIELLYFLLYARYGNSAIACLDQEQFKYKVFATIFQYGPTWQRRLEVQEILRNLDEEELLKGSKAIYNQAYNPSVEPSTSTLEEIPTINQQNTTQNKKSKIEAYAYLLDLLETDVTGEFVDKFKNLFVKFVYTRPDLFITEGEE